MPRESTRWCTTSLHSRSVVPGAKQLWRECESELLLFKLLLRPQLHAPICDIIGRLPVTASFEVAANAVEAVHNHYVAASLTGTTHS